MIRQEGSRFVFLLVVASIIVGIPAPALASSVYSCSFELSEGYVLDDLDGQLGWKGDTSPGDCVVQSSASSAGLWAVQGKSDGSYSGGGALHSLASTSLSIDTDLYPQVIVALDVRVTSWNEADYYIWVNGLSPHHGVGGMEFERSGEIKVNGISTGVNWEADVWKTISFTHYYTTRTTDAYYGSIEVASNVGFSATGDGFGDFNVLTDDYCVSGSSIFFDNLRIHAVPEPGAASLLILGAIRILRRKRSAWTASSDIGVSRAAGPVWTNGMSMQTEKQP